MIELLLSMDWTTSAIDGGWSPLTMRWFEQDKKRGAETYLNTIPSRVVVIILDRYYSLSRAEKLAKNDVRSLKLIFAKNS